MVFYSWFKIICVVDRFLVEYVGFCQVEYVATILCRFYLMKQRFVLIGDIFSVLRPHFPNICKLFLFFRHSDQAYTYHYTLEFKLDCGSDRAL